MAIEGSRHNHYTQPREIKFRTIAGLKLVGFQFGNSTLQLWEQKYTTRRDQKCKQNRDMHCISEKPVNVDRKYEDNGKANVKLERIVYILQALAEVVRKSTRWKQINEIVRKSTRWRDGFSEVKRKSTRWRQKRDTNADS